MRGKVATLVVGILLGSCGVAVAASAGGIITISSGHVVYIKPGNHIVFRGIDLGCEFNPVDPNQLEPAPVLYCSRNSLLCCESRWIYVSRFHYLVSDPKGLRFPYKFTRSP